MSVFHDEIEIEDFEYDEEEEIYHYPCPCGDRFQISKEELLNGEEVATCPSCSLIIKVIYDLESFQVDAEEVETITKELRKLEVTMSGRGGRGRGRGTNKSFSREQLASLGVNNAAETLPEPVTQPPAIFPLLARKPVKLTITNETKYLQMLKQDLIDNLRLAGPSTDQILPRNIFKDNNINKLLAQIPCKRDNFDWNCYPTELRPKLIAKRLKKQVKIEVVQKKVSEKDILEKFSKLEELEKKPMMRIKEEVVDDDPDNELEETLMEDVEDEEMDDGTDYANNYFDNGEAYEDEDDNLDDGPSY